LKARVWRACQEKIATSAQFFPFASGIMAAVSSSAFSKNSEILVKQSWELLKKDTTTNAVIFFTNIFEIAPAAKDLFPFVKNSTVPYEQNAKLKQHATLVFKMTGDAAVQLGEKGVLEVLEPVLKKLATKHVTAGVVDAHFEVVKAALLKTIKERLPELWSTELNQAWADAYDALAGAIKIEMHTQILKAETTGEVETLITKPET
jgi:hemoglobin-like flavoprotein